MTQTPKLYSESDVRKALGEIGTAVIHPQAGLILIDILKQGPESHEVRTLRYKLKLAHKQLGVQGERIHTLRAQLAEIRELISKSERTAYRTLVAAHRELTDSHLETIGALNNVRRENAELRQGVVKTPTDTDWVRSLSIPSVEEESQAGV